MIIKPKIRNNICINAHPAGCEAEVVRQIEYIKSLGRIPGPSSVLVVGASTGYGLASRIVSAFGCGAKTIGVSFEKEGIPSRPGTPGWYNNRAFDKKCLEAGIESYSLNGDAFSHSMKDEVCSLIREKFGQVDLVIYSLASGVRPDPDTGEMYRSVLKPIGSTFSAKSVDFITGDLSEVNFDPATEEEILETIKVMGGEDWKLWINALKTAGVLSQNAMTIAYSYIGPRLTYPIYREGTIGRAKEDLERTAFELTDLLEDLKGKAYVSVNKALVTRASAVIPVVPLYISLLFRIMKKNGTHEGCIEQCARLFTDFLYAEGGPPVDEKGRIRIDDLEMREDIQTEVDMAWKQLTTGNLEKYCDLDGYRTDFLRLHGFALESVNYDEDADPV